MAHKIIKAPRAPSSRPLKVSSAIHQILATALAQGEVFYPSLHTDMIGITHVLMSPDLRYADAFIHVRGDKAMQDQQLSLLQALAPSFKAIVAHKQRLRHTPEIRFHLSDPALFEFGL